MGKVKIMPTNPNIMLKIIAHINRRNTLITGDT